MAYKNVEDERAFQREHYKKNKEIYLKKAKVNNERYRKRNKEYFDEYKMDRGCAYCGYNKHPSALDFHHMDGEDKDGNVARMIWSSWSIEKILTEVVKCIILCACCHRIEHNK